MSDGSQTPLLPPTLKEVRNLYAEALKLQESVLASHRELRGCVAQVETLTVRLKNLGGF